MESVFQEINRKENCTFRQKILTWLFWCAKIFYKEGVFSAEVYLKIISGNEGYDENKFWYLNVVSTFGSTFSIVISPYSGRVLSVQKNIVK